MDGVVQGDGLALALQADAQGHEGVARRDRRGVEAEAAGRDIAVGHAGHRACGCKRYRSKNATQADR